MINLKTLQKNKLNTRDGFTLFVSMIVASLLLAVGFSIGNIILKQLLLSGSGKDSQIAFYAADSGVECAQFWDTKNALGESLTIEGPFASSTGTSLFSDIKCGPIGPNATTSPAKIFVGDSNATSTLVIDYSDDGENYRACAQVQIEKGFALVDVGGGFSENLPFTRITSRGYNSSYIPAVGVNPAHCDISNPRTVERGLFVQY
jgi:hypothetical protein